MWGRCFVIGRTTLEAVVTDGDLNLAHILHLQVICPFYARFLHDTAHILARSFKMKIARKYRHARY